MIPAKELRDRLRTEPFEPFELQLSTGESFPVRHPENLVVGKRTCYLFAMADGIAEEMIQLSLLHIVKVKSLNGQKRASVRKAT